MATKKKKRLLQSRSKPAKRKAREKKPDKRKGLRGAKKRAETIRREKISRALKAYNRKKRKAKTFLEGDTKADKAWGAKLAKEAERAKKEARKKPPKVRSKVRVPSVLPEVFTDDAKGKVADIEASLRSALEVLSSPATQEALGTKLSLNANVRAHTNADGSFDAELIVKGIPRGLTMRELSIYVENLIGRIPGTFISVGFRSSHTGEYTKEKYNRIRGKVQVQTHFHRSNKKAIAFVHAREIDSTLIDRKYHKPEDFFVRLHWNPENKKPTRKH